MHIIRTRGLRCISLQADPRARATRGGVQYLLLKRRYSLCTLHRPFPDAARAPWVKSWRSLHVCSANFPPSQVFPVMAEDIALWNWFVGPEIPASEDAADLGNTWGKKPKLSSDWEVEVPLCKPLSLYVFEMRYLHFARFTQASLKSCWNRRKCNKSMCLYRKF